MTDRPYYAGVPYEELWRRIEAESFDAVAALDEVPRSDPFWTNPNHHATRHKAHDWLRNRLAEDPSSASIRWTLIGYSLAHCDFEVFGLFVPIIRQDPANMRWLVEANEYIFDMSGADYSGRLREALLELRGDSRVDAYLKSSPAEPAARRAVETARNILERTSPGS